MRPWASCGTGRASRLSAILLTVPGSHQRIPESRTAITVVGAPVVVCQAVSTLFPWTPQSSWGFEAIAGSAVRSAPSFQSAPSAVQLEGTCGVAVTAVWR